MMTRILDVLGKIIAPSTILTALVYYFGFTRTRELYSYFGIDYSLLGFSTVDYVLRSTVVLGFTPLLIGLLGGLVICWVHFLVGKLMRANLSKKLNLLPWFLSGLLLIIGLALILNVAKILPFQLHIYRLASTLGLGLTGYSLYLIAQLINVKNEKGELTPLITHIPLWLQRVSFGQFIALVIFGLFWTMVDYSSVLGAWTGQQIAIYVEDRPCIIIYSQKPLIIEAPNIKVTQVSDEEDAFRYRYTGFKFLVRTNDKYFLLSSDWTRGNAHAIIIPDDEYIRVEVAPGPECSPDP
jgi:hypothetical protein